MSIAPKYIFGDTRQFTWVSSGQSPSPISIALIDGNEVVVNSSTMTSSGDGHYYQAMTLPTSDGFYVAEWLATVSGQIYKRRERFQIVTGGTD